MWYRRPEETKTHVPKVAGENISLARCIYFCPNFSIFSGTCFFIPWRKCAYVCVCVCVYVCIYIYIYLTAWKLYMNYCCYQIIVEWNFLTQIGSGVYVLIGSFITETPARRRLSEHVTFVETFYNFLFKQLLHVFAAPSYIQIFFLIAFFKETFIRIIILLWTNYTITIILYIK